MSRVAVRRAKLDRKKPAAKLRHKREYIPNSCRAVCDAYIATVKNGRRIIKRYKSGDLLEGRILQ